MSELVYVGVRTDKLQERAEKEKPKFSSSGSRSPAVWLSLEDGGEYLVRLLPPWTAEGLHAFIPYLRILQHWDVGPQGKRVICPKVMDDLTGEKHDCFVCEQIEQLKSTKDPADLARADGIRAGQSFIYQVIDRNDPIWKPSDKALENSDDEVKKQLIGKPKLKFMRLPWTANNHVLDFYNDADYGDLSDPFTGTDLKITRNGTGRKTVYGITPRRNSTPLFGTPEEPDEATIKAAMDLQYELDQHPFFKVPTYDETKAIYLGLEKEESGESGSAPAGALPTGGSDLSLWIARAKETSPMSVDEVASWGGWTTEQIPECYGLEPDHSDDGCQSCPVKAPCSSVYFRDHNSYSIGDKPAAPAPLMGKSKLSGKKSSAEPETSVKEESGEESVEDMAAMLESAASKR